VGRILFSPFDSVETLLKYSNLTKSTVTSAGCDDFVTLSTLSPIYVASKGGGGAQVEVSIEESASASGAE